MPRAASASMVMLVSRGRAEGEAFAAGIVSRGSSGLSTRRLPVFQPKLALSTRKAVTGMPRFLEPRGLM